MEVVGKKNPIVESIISNVAVGASEDPFGSRGAMMHMVGCETAFGLTFSAYKRLATARDIDQDLVKTMGQTIG
jgi:hypothetical protein